MKHKDLGVWLGIALALVAVAFIASFVITAAAEPQSCRTTGPGTGIYVNLDNEKHANIIDHARDAVRRGQPRQLHINRAEADAHRRASLRGFPTKPGFDRDEYPPAATDEGGAGADVRYVPSTENRSAGSRVGHALSDYCAGQAWILEP